MASAKVTPHGRRQRVLQFLTSTLIAEYELSVMSIGGSSGSDPTITAAEFGEYEAAGDVRYVLVSSGGQGGGFDRGGAGGATTLLNGAGAGIPRYVEHSGGCQRRDVRGAGRL
jgi:hypothetical protein